jgi:hypothetical protein
VDGAVPAQPQGCGQPQFGPQLQAWAEGCIEQAQAQAPPWQVRQAQLMVSLRYWFVNMMTSFG